MKFFLTFILAFNIMSTAFADTACSTSMEEMVTQISSLTNCDEAISTARTCAWGSSADTQTVVAAESVCEKDLKDITVSDSALKLEMTKRCASLCNPQTDGTLCLSSQAFCRLNVVEFILQFYRNDVF